MMSFEVPSGPTPAGPRGVDPGGKRRAQRPVEPTAKPPACAAEGEVGDGGEAGLVLAQREQEMGRAVGRGQVAVGDADAVAKDPPASGAYEYRATLPHEPHAQAAALEH